MCFGRFSAGLHYYNHSASVDGIPIFGRLAAIFTRLEFVGLLYLMHFAGEVQATPHSNLATLRLSITMEWDLLAADYIP
jgi:hypothetical protein